MGQLFSAVGGNGVDAGGDALVPPPTSEPVSSKIKDSDDIPHEKPPSNPGNNLTADPESGAPQERQEPVVGDLTTEKEHKTREFASGDAPQAIANQIPELAKDNDAIPSDKPPSNPGNNLSAELGASQAGYLSVGGGTPAQRKHQTFALVIGINKYGSVQNENLTGAVKDAENFKAYLEDLGVPNDNIINLRDEEATRSAIIDRFRQLEGDPKIVAGEVAIIIYFAGHGAIATKPATWTDWVSTDKDTIEMLCPADVGALDTNGKVVEGIPDRTISRLLLDLSIAKGNNITLILDCCHAAGMNRGVKDSRVRSLRQRQELSPNCDEDIYSREDGTRLYQDKKSGFSHHSFWGSHVLLAACKSKQKAQEDDGQGIFTSALLKSLKYFASKDVVPTYDSLMKHVTMPDSEKQTPLWDGKHIRRRLFDSWQDPAGSFMIPCYNSSPSNNHLILSAGTLHGITKDSTFEIFKSDSIHSNPKDRLAVLTVTEVQHHISHLLLTPPHSSLFDSPHNEAICWYARLRKASGPPVLNIYCNNSRVLDSILTESSESEITVTVDITKNPDEADLCVMVEKNDVSFRVGKRLSTNIEFPSQFSPYDPCPVSYIADIRNFINRFAHFIFQLLTPGLVPIKDFARIEMDKLRSGGRGKPHVTDSVVVLRKVKNGGLVEVVASSKDRYGFTIHRNYNVNLHVYFLYFDASTLEIDAWYSPQKAQKEGSVDPFLQGGNSEITFGRGKHHDGLDPVEITLPDGQDVDVCFFKILVTTEAIDIGPIEQPEFTLVSDTQSRGARPNPPTEQFDLEWASEVITVVSKRA